MHAPARLFSPHISGFQNSLDEVTLIASMQNLKIKSFVDDMKGTRSVVLPLQGKLKSITAEDPTKALHTEVQLFAEQFSEFSVHDVVEITFCLKELKVRHCPLNFPNRVFCTLQAILLFSDWITPSSGLDLYMDTPGRHACSPELKKCDELCVPSPIVFSCALADAFVADFVLATLHDSQPSVS